MNIHESSQHNTPAQNAGGGRTLAKQLADLADKLGSPIVVNVPRSYAYEDWLAEGSRLFGSSQEAWRFQCPSCGHVASAKDWTQPYNLVLGFLCQRSFAQQYRTDGEPIEGELCNELIAELRPVTVTLNDISHQMFDFAR